MPLRPGFLQPNARPKPPAVLTKLLLPVTVKVREDADAPVRGVGNVKWASASPLDDLNVRQVEKQNRLNGHKC